MIRAISRITFTAGLGLLISNAASAQTTLKLTLTGGQHPVQAGDLVQVAVSVSGLTQPAAGFQAFIHFNPAELTFLNGAYTPRPFGMEVIAPVTATPGGDIDIASGINQFAGQNPSSADAQLAYLQFIAAVPACQELSVQFRTHSPPTRLTTLGGTNILPLTLIGVLANPNTCPGDQNHDGQVNTDDLLIVINHWGPCPTNPPCCVGDVDNNHFVNVDDLLFVINGWGPCPFTNDNCSNATDIGIGNTVVINWNNATATEDGLPIPPPANPCNIFGDLSIARDIWFKWTAGPDADGIVRVQTCANPGFDNKMAMYALPDACPPTGIPVGCADDAPICASNSRSAFDVNIVPGQMYLIRVGSYNAFGPSGPGTLQILNNNP